MALCQTKAQAFILMTPGKGGTQRRHWHLSGSTAQFPAPAVLPTVTQPRRDSILRWQTALLCLQGLPAPGTQQAASFLQAHLCRHQGQQQPMQNSQGKRGAADCVVRWDKGAEGGNVIPVDQMQQAKLGSLRQPSKDARRWGTHILHNTATNDRTQVPRGDLIPDKHSSHFLHALTQIPFALQHASRVKGAQPQDGEKKRKRCGKTKTHYHTTGQVLACNSSSLHNDQAVASGKTCCTMQPCADALSKSSGTHTAA